MQYDFYAVRRVLPMSVVFEKVSCLALIHYCFPTQLRIHRSCVNGPNWNRRISRHLHLKRFDLFVQPFTCGLSSLLFWIELRRLSQSGFRKRFRFRFFFAMLKPFHFFLNIFPCLHQSRFVLDLRSSNPKNAFIQRLKI